MKGNSQQESNRLRLHRLVATVFGIDFGSLWWVPDVLWQREISTFKPRADGRHPGLCIRSESPASEFDPWPLLLGRSEPGPVSIAGINAEEPEKIGHFGKLLRPGFFGAPDFAAFRGQDRSQNITPNRFKPILSDDEKTRLEDFLQKKGLL